jgi:hypothetical protein
MTEQDRLTACVAAMAGPHKGFGGHQLGRPCLQPWNLHSGTHFIPPFLDFACARSNLMPVFLATNEQ